MLAACANGGDSDLSSAELSLGGQAAVNLTNSNAHMTLTSNTEWTLDKQGSVNPATHTVTWTITATKGTTQSGILIVDGTMTVKNTGNGVATIGNIVVNLQARSGNTWVTKSSDIANATQDDAATSAKVVAQASSENKSMFTENTASGHLVFMDAQTNSAFALVPQVSIPSGTTRKLLFKATFDNNVLHLNPGTSTRIEMILSFGNAGGGASKPNIDINGNGLIDPDEARVRSVPSRLGLSVPNVTPANQTVTLTDALSDITKTGTVTFTNAQFNLGTTTGTVTVNYDGGTSGGTLTNCAHLKSQSQNANCGGHTFSNVLGVNLTDCDTQVIGPHACSPGLPGCGWEPGDVVTYSQDGWGEAASIPGGLLVANFDNIYINAVEVGISGTAGFSMRFFDVLAVFDYLPASGANGPLTGDLIDPTSSSSGLFGGNVLALRFDVDLSDVGALGGTSGLRFGDLRMCNFTTLPALNGMTVRQYLALVNTLLGGGSGPYSIDDLNPVTFALTQAFLGGAPSTFAQQQLFSSASCPI